MIPIAAIIIFGLIKGEVHDFSFIQSFSLQGQEFGMAILGTLNGYLMTGARIPFAMAKRLKGIHLLRWLGLIEDKSLG